MGIFYTKKKDNFNKNTADPWNTYGVDFGKKGKADSQKETFINKSATEDLPALPVDEDSDEPEDTNS